MPVTPNLNLNIPDAGTPNWDALLNDNFDTLDSVLGGTTPLPGDLAVTGKLTQYNGLPLVGAGLSSVVAKADATVQGASIASTLLFTPAVDMLLRIDVYCVVTRAASSSSSILGSIIFTDADSATVETLASTAQTGNTVGAISSQSFLCNAKGGVGVNFSTTYASSGGTTMQYAVHVVVTAAS